MGTRGSKASWSEAGKNTHLNGFPAQYKTDGARKDRKEARGVEENKKRVARLAEIKAEKDAVVVEAKA